MMEIMGLMPSGISFLLAISMAMMRFAAFFGLTTVFRKNLLNARLIAGFSFVLAMVVATILPMSHVQEFSLSSIFLGSVSEVSNGFIFAIIVNIIFGFFKSGGQMTSLWSGLSSAMINDTAFGSVTPLTRFYVWLSLLVLFLSNGHLLILAGIAESFHYLPYGVSMFSVVTHPDKIVSLVFHIFTIGLVMSLPVMVSLLVVNFSLAVASRFSPQVGLFSVGIPLLVVAGFCILLLIFDSLVGFMQALLVQYASHLAAFAGVSRHG